MADRPSVLAIRELPEAVESRLVRDYRARFNAENRLYSSDDLIELVGEADAILPYHPSTCRRRSSPVCPRTFV